MASGLSPTINYLPGTYFGCLDKSAAAVFRASPDKVLRVLDSPELLATYMANYGPGWESRVNKVPSCTGATFGPSLPPNPAHKPDSDVDATLALFEGPSAQFTAVLPPTNAPAVLVPPGACKLSTTPGENFMLAWFNPSDPGSTGWRPSCTYLLSELVTADQLTRFQQNVDTVTFNNLMTALTSRVSTACPLDPITGSNQGNCSVLRSLTEVGAFARNWYATISASQRDAIMTTICSNNPTLTECKCVTRSADPDYKLMKQIQGISDSCWYLPCANSGDFFVPSTIENPNCPTNVCQIVSNYIDNNAVTVSNNSSVLSCATSNTTTTADPTTGTPSATPPAAKTGTPIAILSVMTLVQANPKLVVIGGGVLLILIVILVLVR